MNVKTYSVCIPVFCRFFEFKKTLQSILDQTYPPIEIIVVDNNNNKEESERLKSYINNFDSKIKIILVKNKLNSGAIARNIGANLANGDFVALIDSDVLLDRNYAQNIIKIFNTDKEIIGVQGVDTNLQDEFIKTFKSYKSRFIYLLEYIFQSSQIFLKGKPLLLPSLVVTHPSPPFNFYYESEWISTCACFFKKSAFDNYQFCNQFITYSWNEYILFSHSIYKDNIGKLIYTSSAEYTGIITNEGRLPKIPLQYMAEVYDQYIFRKLFKFNFVN